MIPDEKKTFDFHAGVRPLHSHPQCAEGRNLETDASKSEGKGKPSLGDHSSLWCDLNCHHQEAKENPLARFSW